MNKKYDVIIIGAGVGGLACGCYLAKKGLRVLIVEQRNIPGGYCSSFEKNGFRFDVGVHYLGGIRNGSFGKILEELELKEMLLLKQFDPTDKIIMGDNSTYIRANLCATIEEFNTSFPKEKSNIKKFFTFIMQRNFYNIYKKCKNLTFKKILDEFFNDKRIKAILEALLGNIGLTARRSSALSSIVLYREYILDGGYYPEKGIQFFSDALVHRFKDYRGETIFEKKVEKILLKADKVTGVELANGEKISSNIVVSNADATLTFKKMLNKHICKEGLLVDKLSVSPSIFALYLGIDKNLSSFTRDTCSIWSFDDYEVEKYFSNLEKNIVSYRIPFVVATFPSAHNSDFTFQSKSTVQLFLIVPTKTKISWKEKEQVIADKLIRRAQDILPGIERHIKIQVIATPETFYKYTLNKNGAAFGWASTVDQISHALISQKTSVHGLFLVGHWCMIGSGQGGVAKSVFSGKRAAELIIERMEK